MSRGLTTAFKTAIGSSVVYPAFFVEFYFESGTTRFWTGDIEFIWGGNTYIGGSILGSIDLSGETEDIESKRLLFTLNGVDQSYYNTALSTKYRGNPVKLYFNLLNSAGNTVMYSYLLEEARMDQLTIIEGDQTISLQLTAESRLVDLFKPNRVYLNPEDLGKDYPSDTFYDLVPTLTNKRLPWGLKGAKSVADES